MRKSVCQTAVTSATLPRLHRQRLEDALHIPLPTAAATKEKEAYCSCFGVPRHHQNVFLSRICSLAVITNRTTTTRTTSSSSSSSRWLALCTPARMLHGKPTQGHKVRTQHSRRWWLQSKARHLTAMPHEEARSRPHFPSYNEDVDKPMVVPDDACCFNCTKPIDSDNVNSYVWVPAGNARVPTSQGYFFHFHCFKCWRCHFRLMHNQFYSKDGKAWCISCALGRDIRVPSRRWHTSYVNTHRTGSRLTGEFFPRQRSQMEFLFNPDE